jgi:hypothetical protein
VGLSPEVQQFLADVIDSVETLELLLLLRRSPDAFWSSEAAAQQLGIRAALSAKKLAQLGGHKLLVRGAETGAYRYAPADDAMRAVVDELAAAYDEQRIVVINAIYSGNVERLRAFSDAFRLKDE